MQTEHDDHGMIDVSSRRGEWRFHVPVYVLVLLGTVFNGGTCTRQSDVAHEVRALSERVARIEGALGVRVADRGRGGSEGTGGTQAE